MSYTSVIATWLVPRFVGSGITRSYTVTEFSYSVYKRTPSKGSA